jgi:hypothetical protein
MKHKFLALFSGVASAFVGQSANSAVIETSISPPQISIQNTLNALTPNGQVFVRNSKGDEFEFTLKRSEETGLMMAGHRSHSSHSSHRSHSSHYSSR